MEKQKRQAVRSNGLSLAYPQGAKTMAIRSTVSGGISPYCVDAISAPSRAAPSVSTACLRATVFTNQWFVGKRA